MTSTFATQPQIETIKGMLERKAWNDADAVSTKFITRAAAVNLAVSWAIDPSAMGSAVTDVATSSEVGIRVNQILAHAGTGAEAGAEYAWAPLTRKGASNMIGWLSGLPKKATAKAAPAAPAKQERVELEDGMYLFDGNYYKVQHAVHGSGNQYAKVAVIEDVPSHLGAAHDEVTVRFEYARGVVAKLRPEHKLTYEQAKAFGALYGTCCRCGKTLTDELSIALGIGPVCGGREFGGEFKAILKAAKLELKAAK